MTITYNSISTSMPTSEVIPVQATVNERPIEDNVYFEVVSKDYADHILTFTLKNVGYRTLPYGHPYRVDEKVDGSWHELDLGIAHTLELLEWNPSAEKEIRLNLSLWKPSHKAKEFRMRIPLSIKEGVDVAIPFTREDLRQGSSR